MIWWTAPPSMPWTAEAELAIAAGDAGGYDALLTVTAIIAIGYFISLILHPYVPCHCGSGRHFGSVYKRAFRPCGDCDGSGRKLRLGARLFRNTTRKNRYPGDNQ